MKLTAADEDKYLSVLSIIHYVMAIPVILVGCFPLIHLTIGLGMLLGDFPVQPGSAPPPEGLFEMVGSMFVVIATIIVATFWGLGISMIVVGRALAKRRFHTFCLVVAFFVAMFAPLGTILGLLTILLLVQPTVRARFEGERSDPPGATPEPA